MGGGRRVSGGWGGLMDWLEVEFRFDKADKRTVTYLMMSGC